MTDFLEKFRELKASVPNMRQTLKEALPPEWFKAFYLVGQYNGDYLSPDDKNIIEVISAPSNTGHIKPVKFGFNEYEKYKLFMIYPLEGIGTAETNDPVDAMVIMNQVLRGKLIPVYDEETIRSFKCRPILLGDYTQRVVDNYWHLEAFVNVAGE